MHADHLSKSESLFLRSFHSISNERLVDLTWVEINDCLPFDKSLLNLLCSANFLIDPTERLRDRAKSAGLRDRAIEPQQRPSS